MKIITHMQLWLRAVRYRQQYKLGCGGRPRARYYRAEGGPLDGKLLALVDGDTAPLRVGTSRGRYLCGLVAGRTNGSTGTTVWKPRTTP